MSERNIGKVEGEFASAPEFLVTPVDMSCDRRADSVNRAGVLSRRAQTRVISTLKSVDEDVLTQSV